MPYFLAVDGGGTKTHTICANESGQIVGEGSSGPISLTATSIGAASFNLREAIRQAIESLPTGTRVQKLVVGLAGMDTPQEQTQAEAIFGEVIKHFPIDRMQVVSNAVISLESGTDALNALVVISGTGSICYGRNAGGQTAKTSGMDYLLTDQGSGYTIGRQVLREAVKSYDGRRPKSILEDLVCQHFHIASIAELKDAVYNPPLTKGEIAELTKMGLVALEQGDVVAKAIFDHANESLVSMASTVIKRLQLHTESVDCVVAGNILKIPYVIEHFRENMQFVCHHMSIVQPTQSPAHGALKIAMRQI